MCVSHDLRALQEVYKAHALHLRDEYVRQELMKLDALEQDVAEKLLLMREWFQKFEEARAAGDVVAAAEILDEEPPDAKFRFEAHGAMLKIMKRRAELLGLDAPTRVELAGRDGQPIEHRVVEMSDRELDALIAEERRQLRTNSGGAADDVSREN